MAKSYYQRPDGLYEVSRTINGKRVKFYGRTQREVDRKILEYNDLKAKGRLVSVIANEWFAEKEQQIRPATYDLYKRAVCAVENEFGNKHATEIKPIDIQRFMEGMAKKDYSKSTAQIQLTVFKQIFQYAVIQGDIDINPVRECYVSKQSKKEKKRSALTIEQEQLVIAKGDLILKAFLYTGCRRGELVALRYEDIDRKNKTIRISKKVSYVDGSHPVVDDYLKTENGDRTIPLFPQLEAILPRNRIGLIFCNDKGTVLKENEFKQMLRKAKEEIGLPEEITPHCFRHSFATICYESGVIDEKSAAKLLGDREETTRKVYQELRDSKHNTDIDLLFSYINAREEKMKNG